MIPVVLAADRNYAVPMSVTIGSLLQNAAPETQYDIYILAPEEFPPVSKMLFQKYEEIYPGCKINFLIIKDVFAEGHLDAAHITTTTFYRLLIPSLLPQYSKCIYLDTDIAVNADLTDLYQTDLEGFYIAGVRDVWYMYCEERVTYETQRLNLPSVDNYINAGMLVMNLDEIRKHNLQKEFVELSTKFNDQDVLNICCYGSIKILPLTFNVLALYVYSKNGQYYIQDNRAHVYPEAERKDAMENPAIVHYITNRKPWNNHNCSMSEYWRKYLPCSTFYVEQMYQSVLLSGQKAELDARQETKKARQELHRQKDKLRQTELQAQRERQRYEKEIRFLKQEMEDMERSLSFRLGRILTYIPRKIRGGILCCKEQGICYTVRLAVSRIFGKNK